MMSPGGTDSRRHSPGLIRRWFLSEHLVLGLTLLLFLCLAPVTPGLATRASFLNILSYLLPLLVVAVGMTVVMITGGIDLSVTSIIALTSVAGASLISIPSVGVAGSVAVMMILGGVLGALNGAAITVLRLPAFIVTLASMMFWSGFAIWITQSKNIGRLPENFLVLGRNLPIMLVLSLGVCFLVHLSLQRTIYGRWLYATGQNPVAARISGVPVQKVTLGVYVVSGLCAGLASVLLTARLETGSPVLAREILLDIIGATVVGGTSLFGGRGKVSWTLSGVIFLTLLDNALNLLNLSQFSITITKGTVILGAAVLDSLRMRMNTRAT